VNINWPASTTFKRPVKRGRRKVSARRASPEHSIQVAIAGALDEHCKHLWWAVENGGKRHIRSAQKLKRAGVRPGVPDLHFVLPGGRLACLELKAEKGRLSPAQEDFRDRLTAAQGWWGVAYSVDEAFGILAAWGCLPSEVRK
jgi:hypothetical protein